MLLVAQLLGVQMPNTVCDSCSHGIPCSKVHSSTSNLLKVNSDMKSHKIHFAYLYNGSEYIPILKGRTRRDRMEESEQSKT
jgi:hypothetical protein